MQLSDTPTPTVWPWEAADQPEAARRAAFDAFFETFTPDTALPRGQNLFRGVYASLDEAQRALPTNRPEGYDNDASGRLYLSLMRLVPQDYPALYWVRDGLDQGLRKVVDLGGSVGIKFYAFRRVMPLPEGLQWTVVDMPAVLAVGGELAASEQAGPALRFDPELSHQQDCELLFASGAVQYLPQTLGAQLAGWSTLPRRIVINTTPLHPTRSYYTVNVIGTAYCPYRIQSHGEFVREFTKLGYRLRDHWSCVGRSVHIPFHDEATVPSYSGFCFERPR